MCSLPRGFGKPVPACLFERWIPQVPPPTSAGQEFPRLDKPASSRPLRCNSRPSEVRVICSPGRSPTARGVGGAFAGPGAETSQGRALRATKGEHPWPSPSARSPSRTPGFVGTLRTLNAAAALAIVPVDKTSDNGPDYRVYAGQRRYEIGAGWSQVAKSSGETYVNLKIAAPGIRPELAALPPRQARTSGRGRRHPHRAVGAARPLTATPRRGSLRRGLPSPNPKFRA